MAKDRVKLSESFRVTSRNAVERCRDIGRDTRSNVYTQRMDLSEVNRASEQTVEKRDDEIALKIRSNTIWLHRCVQCSNKSNFERAKNQGESVCVNHRWTAGTVETVERVVKERLSDSEIKKRVRVRSDGLRKQILLREPCISDR